MLFRSSLQADDEYRNRTDFCNVAEESKLTIEDEIEYALQRLKRAKRTFVRLLKDADAGNIDNELNSIDVSIWNAREVLREAYMSAGDVLLWSVERRKEDELKIQHTASSKVIDRQDTIKTLQKALQCFTSAKDLVVQQQKLHKVMNPDPSNNVIMYTFFGRNLLLLQIKAQINIGIPSRQFGIVYDGLDHGRMDNHVNPIDHEQYQY